MVCLVRGQQAISDMLMDSGQGVISDVIKDRGQGVISDVLTVKSGDHK